MSNQVVATEYTNSGTSSFFGSQTSTLTASNGETITGHVLQGGDILKFTQDGTFYNENIPESQNSNTERFIYFHSTTLNNPSRIIIDPNVVIEDKNTVKTIGADLTNGNKNYLVSTLRGGIQAKDGRVYLDMDVNGTFKMLVNTVREDKDYDFVSAAGASGFSNYASHVINLNIKDGGTLSSDANVGFAHTNKRKVNGTGTLIEVPKHLEYITVNAEQGSTVNLNNIEENRTTYIGTYTNNAIVFNAKGGDVTLGNDTILSYAGAKGVLNVSAGDVNIKNHLYLGYERLSDARNGNAIVNVTDGTLKVGNTSASTDTTNTTGIIISSSDSLNSARLYLSGGTIETTGVSRERIGSITERDQSEQEIIIALNGGTLKITDDKKKLFQGITSRTASDGRHLGVSLGAGNTNIEVVGDKVVVQDENAYFQDMNVQNLNSNPDSPNTSPKTLHYCTTADCQGDLFAVTSRLVIPKGDSQVGAYTKIGRGTLVLTADNKQTGETIIKAGTLQAGNGGTTGTFGTGNITVKDGATVGINRSNDYQVANQITGEAGSTLRKQGDGTVSFTQAVTISKTLIDDGTLQAGTTFNGGDVTVGNNIEGPATANLTIASGQTPTMKSVVINTDGKVTNEGTLSVNNGTGSITVNGGTLASSGTTIAGTLTVDQGTNPEGTTRQGEVNITGGTTTATTTTVNAGTITASGENTTFNARDMTVGDQTGTAGTASVVVKEGATTKATSVTIKGDDGKVDVQTSGTLTVEKDGQPADIKVNGGELAVSGTANAKNITSDEANDGDKDAKISIAGTGTVNLKPTTEETLFSGFNSGKGDTIGLAGNLNVDVADGVSVTQDSNANITALNDAKGTLNKKGAGTLTLTASNTLATTNVETGTLANTGTLNSDTTNINDGKLSNTGTLSSTEINVGDGKGGATTAILENSGTGSITSTTVNVKADGKLSNTATDNKATTNKQEGIKVTGTLNVQGGQVESSGSANIGTLTVDKGTRTESDDAAPTETAGSVSITGGDTTVKTTQINDGAIEVSGGKLNAGAVTVGDGDDKDAANNAASFNITGGAVEATSVTVKSDGNLTNSVTDDNEEDDVQKGLNVTGELKTEGGTINSSGTTTAGKLTVDQGTNTDGTIRQGEVNITGGKTTVKGDTEIKSGSVAVETAGKLATEGTLKVGDKAGGPGTATLTNAGEVTANNVEVNKDGKLTNTSTTGEGLKVTNELKVDGGTLDTSGTTTAGSLTVESGAVNVKGGTTTASSTTIKDGEVAVSAGKLDGGAITVGDADSTKDSDAAKLTISGTGGVVATSVTVKGDGNLTNSVTDENEGDNVQKGLNVTGELKVESGTLTSSGTTKAGTLTVTKAEDAAQAGTVKITGGTTTANTTNIDEGKVEVSNGATLSGDVVAVGDGQGNPGTASLTNNGTVNASSITVKSDATLTNNKVDDSTTPGNEGLNVTGELKVESGTLTSSGTTKADALTVTKADDATQAGTVNITGGKTDVTTTNLNDGAVTVASGATLDSDTLNVGNEDKGIPNTATLTNNGTVTSQTVNIKADGKLENTGSLGTKTSPITDINVQGGTLNSTGTTQATNLTASSGTVALGEGSNTSLTKLDISGGDVDIDIAGTVTATTANISGGDVDVNKNGTLNTTNIAISGGTVDVNEGGKITASSSANLSGGTTTVHQGGTFDLSQNGDLTLSGGDLTSDGTVKADEIIVNSKDSALQLNAATTANKLTASAGIVSLGAGGTTTLNQELNISGTADVDVAGTVTASTANISGGDVDVNKNGTLNTTNIAISGGTVDVNEDGKITASSSANLSGGGDNYRSSRWYF
ncbi:beta strand repeat-containing protein [Gallibacterium genomosp. 3]|uniref:beta strand repeat-containing protein n=1 Tax=Gallibacterium genomosp. 3 TaxID=505345 RepID=UPI0009F2C831|nr:autotransporter-associated beta strand repeat-containing protein [Gallibacterium genomosp. 3]